jgi:uncharacterized delta-60 repeat protein
MSSSVKVSGVYKSSAPYVKVGDTWKFSKEAWSNVDGNWKQFFLAGGLNDTRFKDERLALRGTTRGATGDVNAFAQQSDGKIIVGGDFSTYNSSNVQKIVRLNTDGTKDLDFLANTGTGFNGPVESIAVQADDKIIIVGYFTTFNGTTVNRIVRLNSNGTLDTTFATNLGSGANNIPYDIAIQSDGKIILVGAFTSVSGYVNGVLSPRIVRLNSNGTRDSSFTTNIGTGPNNDPASVQVQSDGKIVIVGSFTTFNGVTVNRIVRLNSDGTRDTAFTTNTGTAFSAGADLVRIQPNGQIVVSGSFGSFNGTTSNDLARLNSNGTLDTTFATNVGSGVPLNSFIYYFAIQPDGKIILVGSLTTFNNTNSGFVFRLNSDGTMDTSFISALGSGAAGTNALTLTVAIQTDGKILIGGTFTSFGGVAVNRIVRLNSDGTRDNLFFNSFTGFSDNILSLGIQSDGNIVVGGQFLLFYGSSEITLNNLARLNSNGTLDTAFKTNNGTGPNGAINVIAVQSDNKILIGGSSGFTTFNGTTVNRIARLNSNGTLDTTFTANTGTAANDVVQDIAIQPDGKIIIVGGFTTFNGTTVNRIARINSNGTLDTAFTANTGTGFNSATNSVTIQSDGKIVIGGGSFVTTFNGVTVNRIVRLNSDGTRDTAFTTNTGTAFNLDESVQDIAIQSDGKIILVGYFTSFNGATARRIVRLNSDGTRDTAFTTNTGTAANSNINNVEIQSDGKIVILGNFTSFNDELNISGGIVRLQPNGLTDSNFRTNMGSFSLKDIRSDLIIQADGKIVIGNSSFLGGSYSGGISRVGGDLAL